MLWVTRSHVDFCRAACSWLIARFIDSDAQFIFVPQSEVLPLAEREGALPFDVPGAGLYRQGELSTFEAILRNYNLSDRALLRMAKIVNASESGKPEKDPLAAGLEAIALGYSVRYPDDLQNLEHQFEVFDALYAWCRLGVAREKFWN